MTRYLLAGRERLRRLREERGQGMVEYALIISVVAIGSISALVFLREDIKGLFNKAGSSIAAGSSLSAAPGNNPTITFPDVPTPVTGGVAASGDDVNTPGGNNAGYTGLDGVYTNSVPPGTDTGDACTFTVGGQTFTGVWVNHSDIPGPDADWNVGGQNYDWACLNVSSAVPTGGSVALAPDPATLGDLMTATTSGWTNATYFTYNWRRNSSSTCGTGAYNTFDTNSASSLTNTNTFTTIGDANRCYEVQVVAANAFGSSTPSPTSNRVVMNTPAVPAGGSVSLSPAGPVTTGTQLTASVSGFSNNPTSYQYTWQRTASTNCGGSYSSWDVNTTSQTTNGNTPSGAGDGNRCYRVVVIASNAGGPSAAVTSNAVEVDNPPAPTGGTLALTAAPNSQLGATLTATTSGWANNPTQYVTDFERGPQGVACASVTGGQWSNADTDVENGAPPASSTTYTTGGTDGNRCFRATIVASNVGGNSATVVATPTIFITGPAVPVPGSVGTITATNFPGGGPADGTPDDGDVLTATTSGWSNSPTSYTFTWQIATPVNAGNCSGLTDGSYAGWDANTNAGTSDSTVAAIIPGSSSTGDRCYRVRVSAANGGGSSATDVVSAALFVDND